MSDSLTLVILLGLAVLLVGAVVVFLLGMGVFYVYSRLMLPEESEEEQPVRQIVRAPQPATAARDRLLPLPPSARSTDPPPPRAEDYVMEDQPVSRRAAPTMVPDEDSPTDQSDQPRPVSARGKRP